MLISEGARLKGSRFSNSLYAYGILDEGYKFNVLVAEAVELAWRAFIMQHSVMEQVVVVFILVCILFPSIYPIICFVHSISMIQHASIFGKHLIIISSF
ncbi:unnamed protein product [Triticum turgidum subsp. durum]|uniref:Uncharacterized protein n=1 Tax=Triticum turgidum subsp. durum TaxID=4567 RepID=A0A9R0X132_TRITD|nr:unnamed protein product [Triticum turgidum subsp. durum]